MLEGANSTSKAVAKIKLANIKSKHARTSLATLQCYFHRTPRGGEVGLMSSKIGIRAEVEALESQSIPTIQINMLKRIYKHCFAFILLHKGVSQEDAILPKLFTTYLEEIS